MTKRRKERSETYNKNEKKKHNLNRNYRLKNKLGPSYRRFNVDNFLVFKCINVLSFFKNIIIKKKDLKMFL